MADNIVNLHEFIKIEDVFSLAPDDPPQDADGIPNHPIQADVVIPDPPLPEMMNNPVPVPNNQVPYPVKPEADAVVPVKPEADAVGAADNPAGAAVPDPIIPPPAVMRIPRRMPPRVPSRHTMVLRNHRSAHYNLRVLP